MQLFLMNVVMGFVDFLEKLRRKLLPPQVVFLNFAIGNIVIHRSIYVVAELKIADILKDGPKSIDQLARETQTDPDTLHRIMRTLTSVGIFKAKKNNHFETNKLGKFLQSDLEDSMYAFVKITGENWIADVWGDLLQTTKSGKDYYETKFGISFFEWLKENEIAQEEFDVAMTSISAMSDIPITQSYDFSDLKSIVDIGGGHGSQIITILKANPELKGILFDQPATVESLKIDDILKKEGLSGRLECVGGSFFDSAPAGYDAYFMKSILHDWDDEKAVKILTCCRKAMRKDSILLVTENILKEDENQPDFGKVLDINVLTLMGGRVRTREEYRKIFKDAGLDLIRVIPTPSPFSLLEAKPI